MRTMKRVGDGGRGWEEGDRWKARRGERGEWESALVYIP